MKALIIDDDIDICWILSEILKSKDIEVAQVNSIFEAKTKLKNYYPNLIILDNKLPDGLGINFADYLNKVCSKSKIILITGQHEILTMKGKINATITDYIVKPFTLQKFRSAVDQIIQRESHV